MRLLTIPQPEAFFTVAGARIYHAMPSKTPVPQVAAVFAAAEPTSWVSLERRAETDAWLKRCLFWWNIRSARDLAALGCGAIVGLVRVVEVLDARAYDDPPLARIGGKSYLWRLEPVRMIVPVTDARARPNFWEMPDDLVSRIAEAPDRGTGWGVPDGLAREVYPRGDPRWASEQVPSTVDQLDRTIEESEEIELTERDPLYWPVGDELAERGLARGLAHYMRTHETRRRGDEREVKVDRRAPLMRKLFPDTQWATEEELERRVRLAAVRQRERREAAAARKIARAEKALDAARTELRRREHEYLLLVDEDYRNEVEARERERRASERIARQADGVVNPSDSWVRALEASNRRAGGESVPDA